MVLVDKTGATVDDWCSLVNPQRDLGPQHIHGIQAREVLDAPTFADIVGDLAARLAGRIVVAHNLAFDTRFLVAEYNRIGASVPLVDRLPRVLQPPRADDYLALLDRALLDRHLSTSEQEALIDVAQALNLSYPDVLELHRDYLAALAQVALTDSVITADERADLHAVAGLSGRCHEEDAAARRRGSGLAFREGGQGAAVRGADRVG